LDMVLVIHNWFDHMCPNFIVVAVDDLGGS